MTQLPFRLPATVWPQLWVNDVATDADAPIQFDAHDAMLAIDAAVFARAASEILATRGHDYDDIALKADVIDEWLSENNDATFYVDIHVADFREWLEAVGLTEADALAMDDDGYETLKASLAVSTIPTTVSTFRI